MEPLSSLESEVLGWLLDDYESPQSLHQDIQRELGRPLGLPELTAALQSLCARGLAHCYRFDEGQNEYVKITESAMFGPESWYFASASGRAAMEGQQ